MSGTEGLNVQIREIAKAVATALAASDLTDDEKKPKQIKHASLPWTVPPLLTSFVINGAAVQSLFDMPVPVVKGELQMFWKKTLHEMWHTPGSCMKKGLYRHLPKLLNYSKEGTRAFRFAEPLGYPGQLDHMAGVVFSLEVAHLCYLSLPVLELVSDDSNYYVVLKDGSCVGVKDGRPAVSSPWDFDATGMVLVLLETSRGETTFDCAFDQIAAVRSLIHEHREKLGSQFHVLDLLLQALRFLTRGAFCPDLLTSAKKIYPEDIAAAREKLRVYGEALSVVDADISDRNRLYALQSYLVPIAMSMTGFRRNIFSSPDYPFSMEPGKRERIKLWLQEAYSREEQRCNLSATA